MSDAPHDFRLGQEPVPTELVDHLVGMTPAEKERYRQRCEAKHRSRAVHDAIVEWFAGLPWEWLLTLTFKPRPDGDSHRLDLCKRQIESFSVELSQRLWGRRWRRRKKGVFGGVFWEQHKSGEWHAHALIAGTAGRGRFLKGMHAFCRKHPVLGHLWASPVNSPRTARYAAKYAGKDGGGFDPIGVRWFDDREVPTPLVDALRSEGEVKHA